MCGRYLTPDEAAFERHFGLAAPSGYFQSYNVAPTHEAPVVYIDSSGTRRAALYTWGFRPAWAQREWINARAETVFTSRAFADAARERRCLVAAAGWYEWHGERAPKQPYVHYVDAFAPLAMAGIWTSSVENGQRRRTFAILTRPATASVAFVHERMPAVLSPADYAAWLAGDMPRAALERLLTTTPLEFASRPVSTFVNKPANDDPRCVEPVGDAEPGARTSPTPGRRLL
jgi:putative SOS response-associated peptidase YedK